MLRYKTDETDDGLSGKEGTFLICSFWLVSALAIIGELQRARDLMERLLRVASPLGLYAEEFDADTAPPPRQLPAGVLAPGADRGGRPDHRRRAARGADVMSDYDVIVIGSGAGGGTLAHRLATDRQADPAARARRLAAARARELVGAATSSSTTATCRPDTWYDGDGKPFQPQVHYFVGGATKLYGAALYRLRAEDFGELRHHDGVSPAWPIGYDEMEPYYTEAEQMYRVHGARGEDPTEPPRERAVPVPGARARAAHPAALGRPGGGGLPARSTRRAASCATTRTRRSAPACAARRATASPASCTPSPTPRCSACGRRSSTRT